MECCVAPRERDGLVSDRSRVLIHTFYIYKFLILNSWHKLFKRLFKEMYTCLVKRLRFIWRIELWTTTLDQLKIWCFKKALTYMVRYSQVKKKKVICTCCIDSLLDLMVPWIFLASQNALLALPSSIFPLWCWNKGISSEMVNYQVEVFFWSLSSKTSNSVYWHYFERFCCWSQVWH